MSSRFWSSRGYCFFSEVGFGGGGFCSGRFMIGMIDGLDRKFWVVFRGLGFI